MTQSRPEDVRDLPEAERIAETLGRIWERPEFTTAEPSWIARLLGDLRAALFEWIAGLLSGIGLPENWVSGLGQIVTILFIALGVLAVALLVRRALGSGTRASRASRTPDTPSVPSLSSDPEEWARRARAAAADGRFREASLALYRSVILRLAAAGIVRVLDGRTPGDYAAEARTRNPSIGAPLHRFLQVFHPVAFGPEVAGSDAYGRLASAADEVTRLASPTAADPRVGQPSGPGSPPGTLSEPTSTRERSDG